MGSFADTILSGLFSWLQALINWAWALIDQGGSAFGAWLLRNWLPLTLLLIIAGLVADWIIWMIRWRPYHVWGTRLRRLSRLLGRRPREPALTPLPAQGPDETFEEALGEPVEAPYAVEAASYAQLPPYAEDEGLGMQDPAFYEAPAQGIEDTYIGNPAYQDPPYQAVQHTQLVPLDEEEDFEETLFEEPLVQQTTQIWQNDDWTDSGYDPPPLQDNETFAPSSADWQAGQTIPWQEEADAEVPPMREETQAPVDGILQSATVPTPDMEAESMYDDDFPKDLPDPPQKRRRWELQEQAPEELEPPRAASRPEVPMEDIDPLAAYDAPEVMQRISPRSRRRRSATPAEDRPEPIPAIPEAPNPAPRRRRRSERHQRTEQTPVDSTPIEEDRRGRRAARTPSYEEDLEVEYPEPPEWPDWEQPPDLPTQTDFRPTKPTLFDRLRGMRSGSSAEPPPEKVKKKGKLSNLINPATDYESSKPKPRVDQQDAYYDAVYPDKKGRT